MLSKTKIFPIPLNLDFSFFTLESDSRFSVIIFQMKCNQKQKYFIIPDYISFEKSNNCLVFKLVNVVSENSTELDNFFLSFSKALKGFEKPFKKKIILKGLGFRASVLSESNILELKLGYSHLVNVALPSSRELSVKVDKNTITLEGSDAVFVGNFANRIRNLKFPDSYKGKGFWYKNEIINLKEVKKT